MASICSLTLAALAEKLRRREIGVQEAARACLDRINEVEPQIMALLHVDAENALNIAAKMDAENPEPDKPLWGVPVTVKDAISTKGMPTTGASRILENFVPIYDAFVVERLKNAGAIILGKNNMDEFAMGSATENSAYQKTRNPWNLNKVPGGSSGGSAASVAAGECFASLGSDTGGSIRQPAAFCGCVGLKPTYGRVSRYGLLPFASSLDQIGPLARAVEDCALMLNVIAGHDPRDNTSEDIPTEDYTEYLEDGKSEDLLKNARVGVPRNFFDAGLDNDVRENWLKTIDIIRDAGAEIIDITLPDPDIATATYYVISMAEASSNLARYDGVRYGRRAAGVSDLMDLYVKSRSEGFGEEVKRRIMLGSYVLSAGYYDAYFRKAAQTRRIIYDKYHAALATCDFIFMPAAPVTAWNLGEHEANPLAAYLMDAFTLPVNLAGLPGLSLPVGLGAESKMPVGLQLIGRPFAEKKLLGIARAIERALPPLGQPSLKNMEVV